MGGSVNTGQIVTPITLRIPLQNIAQLELFILELEQGGYVCHLLCLLSLVFRGLEEHEMEWKETKNHHSLTIYPMPSKPPITSFIKIQSHTRN